MRFAPPCSAAIHDSSEKQQTSIMGNSFSDFKDDLYDILKVTD